MSNQPLFETGALVRVARQPRGHHVYLEGLVGVIESQNPFHPELAVFVALDEEGRSTGTGSVPYDCLGRETHPAWERAKLLFEQAMDEALVRAEQRMVAHQQVLERIADQAGVAVETAWQIIKAYEKEWPE